MTDQRGNQTEFESLLLVLLAEPAWRASVATNLHGPLVPVTARFIPRTQAWQIH